MSCPHVEVVTLYREDLARPADQRVAEFRCACGARMDRAEARALHFARLEQDKHGQHETGGVYPGDLNPPFPD